MLWSHKIRQRNFKHHICWCAKFRLSYDIGIVDNRTNSDYHRASTHSWHYWEGPSWSSYGSWINNYLWNRYLSTLKLWVRIPLREGLLDTTWCDKVCQWLAAGRFSPQMKLTPRYSWNIVERGIKDHNSNPTLLQCITQHMFLFIKTIFH
jgi:hypothetical protein